MEDVRVELDPYGFHYYKTLVRVVCGSKYGWFCGGHYDLGHNKQDSDVRVICSCDECRDTISRRWLCTQFEKHAGRERACKWKQTIQTVDEHGNSRCLEKWARQACQKLGRSMEGHRVAIWWPAERQYYAGMVDTYDDGSGCHRIQYEDGTAEDLWLAVESFKDLGKDPSWTMKAAPPEQLASDQQQQPHLQTASPLSASPAPATLCPSIDKTPERASLSAEQVSNKTMVQQRQSCSSTHSLQHSQHSVQPSNRSEKRRRLSHQPVQLTGKPTLQETAQSVLSGPAQEHDVVSAGVASPLGMQTTGTASEAQIGVEIQPAAHARPAVPSTEAGTKLPGIQRSLKDWEDVFCEEHVTNFTPSQMFEAVRDVLLTLRHQNSSLVPTLFGKHSSLPQEEAAVFITRLFQGCSQVFTYSPPDSLNQMKLYLSNYFAAALLSQQPQWVSR